MGNVLNRSSSRHDNLETRKEKRKRHRQQLDQSFDHDPFVSYDEDEHSNLQFYKTYELWNKDLHQQPITKMNGKYIFSVRNRITIEIIIY